MDNYLNFENHNCGICNRMIKSYRGLIKHLHDNHKEFSINPKLYYDKYISTEQHTCQYCGKPCKFISILNGYTKTCGNKACAYKETEATKLLLYNDANYNNSTKATLTRINMSDEQKSDIENKKRNTKLERYASATYNNLDKIQQTKLEKYGDADYCNLELRKKTCLEKYGVENYVETKECKQKIANTKFSKFNDPNFNNSEQAKQTKLEKYGDINFNNREKYKKTCLEKYGVTNTGSILTNINKGITTCNEKYGTDYFSQSEFYKMVHKKYEYNGNSYDSPEEIDVVKFCEKNNIPYVYQPKTFSYTDANGINHNYFVDFKINDKFYEIKCDAFFKNGYYKTPWNRGLSDVEILNRDIRDVAKYECMKNNNVNIILSSYVNRLDTLMINYKLEVFNFIKTIYSGTIDVNNYDIVSGMGLDIYLPEKKLAFDFDELYWHNEINKSNNYHINKTNACEAKGIQLIHIFEDEWLYKLDIVKSRISSLLGCNKRIYARKCEIREVSYKDSISFLNMCHIQGSCVSKYRYGLYYNNELVSLMTFGKSRFKSDEIELLRFCNKLNTNVIGGADRLFKYFLKQHTEVLKIISFADRRWSIGTMYEKLRFKHKQVTNPAYFYVIDNIRHNRIEFQKHKLVIAGNDSSLSEHEIMLNKGIYRIYDCGNLKYTYEKT